MNDIERIETEIHLLKKQLQEKVNELFDCESYKKLKEEFGEYISCENCRYSCTGELDARVQEVCLCGKYPDKRAIVCSQYLPDNDLSSFLRHYNFIDARDMFDAINFLFDDALNKKECHEVAISILTQAMKYKGMIEDDN